MSAPFLVAQISDLHIGGEWGGADPVAGLTRVLEGVFALPDRPDVLLVTGDLVDHGTSDEYDLVYELLCVSPVPVHVLGGNHDLREGLRARFGLSGDAGAPVQYSADLGPLRLVALDTTIPGRAGGELDAERLGWLDAELGDARPSSRRCWPCTILRRAPEWRHGTRSGSTRATARRSRMIVARHPQVRRIVAGHIHQPLVSTLAGRAVLAIPSTYVQARVDFSSPEIELGGGVLGFAIHALVDGDIASFVHSI